MCFSFILSENNVILFFRLNTFNGEAIGGNDYGSVTNRQITFNPGDSPLQTVSVTISDDNIVENNERFTARLTAENGVNIQPGADTATVTIVDNDGLYLGNND